MNLPPGLISLLLGIIKGLKKQPIFLFVFGICLILLLFGIYAMFGMPSDSRLAFLKLFAPWVVPVSFLLAVIAIITFVRQTQAMRPPSAPGGTRSEGLSDVNLYKRYIREAFNVVQKMVEDPLLKTDVHFLLEFLGRSAASADEARVRMRVEYDLRNTSDRQSRFDFVGQIDVAQSMKETVCGRLVIREIGGGEVGEMPLEFRVTNGAGGLQRVCRKTFNLPSQAHYKIKWQTEDYVLDLPYREFWATAQPVLGIRIEVDVAQWPSLTAEAECYRPSVEVEHFESSRQGARFLFDAGGVFLPYQGMFLRVQKSSDVRKRG